MSRPPASGLPASGMPAGGKRPPFAPGNLANVRHGARTPRVYLPLAEQLVAGLLAERPDLASFPEAVGAWAVAEACAALMRRHVAEVGPIDPETNTPRAGALNWLKVYERLAREARQPLGLDPISEAVLSRTRAEALTYAAAVDVEALAERGRLALAARDTQPRDLAGEVLASERAAYALERAAYVAEHGGER